MNGTTRLWRNILLCAMILSALCCALGAFSLRGSASAAETYRYQLDFEDPFDGALKSGWRLIQGGNSYPKNGTNAVRDWRFYGDDHIVFARNTVLDSGKFLYGTANITNYAFEVKVRADVDETLGGFLAAHPGHTPLSLNTTIPFFVTTPSGSAYNSYTGRSVCITNYAVGFYESGAESSGWVGSAVQLKDKFGETFDWREWHTVRIEATETMCRFWLDGVLMSEAQQSKFTRCPTAKGYCGFAANCTVDLKPLHFDDFRYYTQNTSYTGGETYTEGIWFPPEPSLSARKVTVTAGQHGSVKLNGKTASDSQTFPAHSEVKVTVQAEEGYVVDYVKLDGVEMGRNGSFTLSNITKDHTVEAGFTAKKKVDVYLLAGQSNAAGYTPAKGLYTPYNYGGTMDEDRLAAFENGFSDVMYYGVCRTPAPEGAGVVWDYVKPGQGTNPQMMGPELGFAEALSPYYGGENGKAALIKYAFGSTGFQYQSTAMTRSAGNWFSPTGVERIEREGLAESGVQNGLLYQNFLKTVQMAVSSLVEKGYEPVVKGMFWMQGCEDASKDFLAPMYGQNLTDLIHDVRTDLTEVFEEAGYPQDCASLPFVIGKIAASLELAPYRETVLDQMQEVAATEENVRIVESYDFTLPDAEDNNDGWHFPVKGSLAMGNRFADVLAQMTGLKETVTYTVKFDTAGGSAVPEQKVPQWMSAEEPSVPVKRGYRLVGWYLAGETTPWAFKQRSVRQDITLQAHWESFAGYTVTVGTSSHGTVEVDLTTAYDNETVTATALPEEGYKLVRIYVNGQAIEGNTFTVTGNSVVTALFEPIVAGQFVLIAAPSVHGTFVLSRERADKGDLVTVFPKPSAGYVLEGIYVNGVKIEGNYFTVTGNAEITVLFERESVSPGVIIGSVAIGFAAVFLAVVLILMKKIPSKEDRHE